MLRGVGPHVNVEAPPRPGRAPKAGRHPDPRGAHAPGRLRPVVGAPRRVAHPRHGAATEHGALRSAAVVVRVAVPPPAVTAPGPVPLRPTDHPPPQARASSVADPAEYRRRSRPAPTPPGPPRRPPDPTSPARASSAAWRRRVSLVGAPARDLRAFLDREPPSGCGGVRGVGTASAGSPGRTHPASPSSPPGCPRVGILSRGSVRGHEDYDLSVGVTCHGAPAKDGGIPHKNRGP